MNSVPRWFLDIDGVVNAIGLKRNKPIAAEFEHILVSATAPDGETYDFPIAYRPRVVAFINEVNRSGRARVEWLTTWGSQAASQFAPAVGLDEFPVLAELPVDDLNRPWATDWWKITALTERVTFGERFIFTDDDLHRKHKTELRGWFGNENTLLLTPFQNPGLEDWHLERIDDWLTHSTVQDPERTTK